MTNHHKRETRGGHPIRGPSETHKTEGILSELTLHSQKEQRHLGCKMGVTKRVLFRF